MAANAMAATVAATTPPPGQSSQKSPMPPITTAAATLGAEMDQARLVQATMEVTRKVGGIAVAITQVHTEAETTAKRSTRGM